MCIILNLRLCNFHFEQRRLALVGSGNCALQLVENTFCGYGFGFNFDKMLFGIQENAIQNVISHLIWWDS